jgi:hypothetical protein
MLEEELVAKKSSLSGMVIRTALVLGTRYGLIYACDPAMEKREEPHAHVFLFDDGDLDRGECNYDAHSVCLMDRPAEGTVDISEAGYYTADTDDDRVTEDLFTNSAPPPSTSRARGLRSVSEVAGYAHAVGYRGMVYRLDRLDRWTRIDEGLPSTFDVEAIHGWELSDLYAVGGNGEAWHFDGKYWQRIDLPTNQTLTCVKCAPNRVIYMGGHRGTLVRGTGGQWSVLPQPDIPDALWDLEWFKGRLFASTLDGLYELKGDLLEPVKYGKITPRSTYQLSAVDEVMWSSGEFDIMEFDGQNWTRIV